MTTNPELQAVLFDLDGTLYVGDEAVPGAVDAVSRVADLGIPRRYLTNTTRFSRRALRERLVSMGFPVEEDELYTASVAATYWLQARGFRRVAVYLPEAARSDFADFEIVEESPEAVVVGDLGPGWSFERLNHAFRQVLEGAHLVALQKNRYWRTPEGLMLDAGPLVAALEYATGQTATIVGKPNGEFFDLAVRALGVKPGRAVLIGDDIEADVGGAQRAGLRGGLVRTGKFREEALASSGVTPDWTEDSVAEMVERLWP
ncbi:MAG: TIGR01458 family HAD-type hydrolase [Gemmatimonas sp.]|nr:TIGR01458 family HAD-type hydrolase [Gemmatimonas sp.]